ncbi:uncharacterized protein At5g01610 [Ricinus communis]|uniref:uncharacterized protein At5g01610 n=1 Tax=Ricinus communis TaxID=3988 RepID=UPI00201B0B06|nr:uncharacterized protein At5g01610 [Ricinus communis]
MSLTAITTFLLLLLLHSSLTAAAGDTPTAYEVLAGYNFPVGILPKGVTGYELDRTTGKFRAYLNGSCSFSLQGSYQLKYKSTISGYISDRKLTNLSGVSVKVLFLWLNIVEVVRAENDLQFSVGIASASFSLDNFYVCPQCGCGLDCNNVAQVSKLRSNPLLSSI